MHSWQQAYVFHVLLQVVATLLVGTFLPKLFAIFIVVVAFLQKVHALLEELVAIILSQHISYSTSELLPLL
jgi:hypothetical protein